MIIEFYLKYEALFGKNFPGWFYLNFWIYNSGWIIVLALLYASIPATLFISKEVRFLIKKAESISDSFSVLYFIKPIMIISILSGVILFIYMNFLLPGSNYQARTYMQHLKMSENFDASKFQRIQNSNYRSDREKDISMVNAELIEIENQLNNIEQNENMNHRKNIIEQKVRRKRYLKTRLYLFFRFPIYLIATMLLMLSISILLRRLNRITLIISSLVFIVIFHLLFIKFAFLTESLDYPLIILFIPEFITLITWGLLLFYRNKKYVVQYKTIANVGRSQHEQI
jgi:lipopolysaccharide export LptBFGC system permease protein LptF